LPTVNGDERALSVSFSNILRNAVEALEHRTNPEITVILRVPSNAVSIPIVEILFKDNGAGVAPDLVDKIFSPFCTTKARGLGLGMPIAKRTILDHKGQILVHSNTLGTCVTVILPVTSHDYSAS
jgi:signal transduction histidine kinase